MNEKILKVELFALYVVTLISMAVYYYMDSMPDHYLTISSGSSFGFFSYYTSSALSFVNYFTGPWIFAACTLYTIFYVTIYSKRADVLDLFNVLTLFLFCLGSFFYLAPSLIGEGLFQFVDEYTSTWGIFLLWFFSGTVFLLGTFRKGFVENLGKGLSYVKSGHWNLKVSDKLKDSLQVSLKQLEISSRKFLVKKRDEEAQAPEINLEERESNLSLKQQSHAVETGPKEEFLPVQIYSSEQNNKDAVERDDEYVDESEISTFKCVQYQNSEQTKGIEYNDDVYYNLVKLGGARKGDVKFSQPDEKYFFDIIAIVEAKLGEFKIQGQIINVLKGPVVDTFEWVLGPGEKVSRLTSIAEDLSLALSGAPIRMVYPMKGRTTVGIEIPRNPRDFIFLDEIISSKDFVQTTHQLPLAMGKDAFGEAVVVDLASMPHMLVAGSTGAGKSVFINSVLVSLLIKKSPNQMKLILIDPKQLELALYARLPHLIMPVITEAKTAATALLWACQEMERRYSIMSEFGVRNIEGFNHKLKTASPESIEKIRKFYEDTLENNFELPFIVIIVDEFADLILTQKGKEIETHICRLAAKARAAGVHLMLATQRPSVDVITGLIKSNFPTRVSFRVTSSTDSRTILNAMGAEKLLGKGDMLYKQGVDTTRIHSAFIDELEIESLTEKLSEMAPTFDPIVLEFLENGGESDAEEGGSRELIDGQAGSDEKYDEAVRVVVEHRTASASLLQRRLGVGYNRAANLIDEMEMRGVVGPTQGSKPRKVLLAPDSIT